MNTRTERGNWDLSEDAIPLSVFGEPLFSLSHTRRTFWALLLRSRHLYMHHQFSQKGGGGMKSGTGFGWGYRDPPFQTTRSIMGQKSELIDIFFFSVRMKDLDIRPDERLICFGQLLGMCDNLSFPLGDSAKFVRALFARLTFAVLPRRSSRLLRLQVRPLRTRPRGVAISVSVRATPPGCSFQERLE